MESSDQTIENTEINNLTMELLVNKNQYNKILYKVNPAKFKERQLYFDKINENKKTIFSMFETLLNDPRETITRDINNSFDAFVKTCLKHLEIKELSSLISDEVDEEEMLFGTIDDPLTKSLWGEKIKKTNYSF